MYSFLKLISNYIGRRNIITTENASLNLLDVGCSSSIPLHFVKFANVINFLGCDPDSIGIEKVRKKSYLNKFKTVRFANVAASSESKKSFLEIAQKRTGSQIRSKQNNKENLIEIDLLMTSILQDDFLKGSANIIKIDAEGHELEVIKGINLNSEELLCLEVECTLKEDNNLSSIISILEKNNFFLSTFRYHNEQTLDASVFSNKFLRLIYKILRKIPFFNSFNSMWTDLSGNVEFNANKSFIYQIELVFLKRKSFIKQKYINKYKNILLVYGFARYLSKLRSPEILKFIIKNFPSR